MLRQTTERVRVTSNTTDLFFNALKLLCNCTKTKPIPLRDVYEDVAQRLTNRSRKSKHRVRNIEELTSYQLPAALSCSVISRRTLRQRSALVSHHFKCYGQRRMSGHSADRMDEFTFSTDPDNDAKEGSRRSIEPGSKPLRKRTQIPRIVWPQRLQHFLGSLPVRNYANDFVLWDMTADDVWRRYQLLREPRCQAVSRTALSFILSSLATEKPRTRRGMLRYSEVINEMTAQAPPLVPTAAEWTALISFVGRLHKNPSASDVNNCLQIWDEMEGTYAVKADLVTFNVLLDISIKARRWQTVDSLLKEMKSRALHHDRYTWTTLLYGAGLRRDGSEVRRLSRAMLESGEVLDILVINAIISALFRCDESAEAEHLFEHVNRTTIKTVEASSLNHLFDEGVNSSESQRTSLFQQRARMNRAHLRNGETLTHEDTSPRFAFRTPDYLAPDIRTFNMVLGHHCRETGNFTRVGELLEAMERRKIPDSIAMFRSLFCGFRCFGRRGKEWKLEKLHYVFQTLLGASEVRLTRELTLEAIQAFAAVGTRDDVEECWQALDEAWQGQGGSPLKRSSRVVRERELALRAAEEFGSTGQTVSRFSRVPVHDRPTVEVNEVPECGRQRGRRQE